MERSVRVAACLAAVPLAFALQSTAARATANWGYACAVADKQVHLDVSVTFNQGTAGAITASDVNGAVKAEGEAAPVAFAADDIEQYWTEDDAFRISFSRYVGEEPEPARILIVTTCKDLRCEGTYRFTRREAAVSGPIQCEGSEKG
jgi:hypothetical protein